jgi:hypothetical protein
MTEEEMQEYFPKVFPKMYVGQYGRICCDTGWFNIINMLSRNIQHYLDWKPSVPQVTIDQVKEKLGTLRFYYSGGDEYIHGMVTMAEAMSEVTCEKCGNPGETRSKHTWLTTMCNSCNDNLNKKSIDKVS